MLRDRAAVFLASASLPSETKSQLIQFTHSITKHPVRMAHELQDVVPVVAQIVSVLGNNTFGSPGLVLENLPESDLRVPFSLSRSEGERKSKSCGRSSSLMTSLGA